MISESDRAMKHIKNIFKNTILALTFKVLLYCDPYPDNSLLWQAE